MTLALALVLSVLRTTTPTLPWGTSREFARTALAVEARLVDGDVAGAREAARALPVRTPRIAWQDDAGLTAELRSAREPGLAAVVGRWNRVAENFAPRTDGGPADVTIGFAPVLDDGPDGLPLATKTEFGPPFRATIGLSRGKPGVPLRPQEMNMELAYALGRYLGVPESPLVESAMHRDPRPGLIAFMPTADDWSLAARNLDFADRLRAAVEAGRPLGLSLPALRLAKERLDLGTVEQGRPLRTELELENLGAGPLTYEVKPDCSCFDPIPPGQIPPQGRRQVRVSINTAEYVGRHDKILLLRSDDPTRPTIEIPVTFYSRPAYRFFRPGGEKVVVPRGGGAYDFFLLTPPGSTIHVVRYDWSGMEAKVTWESWAGTLADPEMKEGPLPRTGWKFRIQIPAGARKPRDFGTLSVETDSRLFHTLMASLYVQKGIVADPVVLGDIETGAEASFIVDRPNAPFKILSVDAGPLFKATFADRRGGWEYRIDLKYLGGGQRGDLWVPVHIRTDDPMQPIVDTVLSGHVK